MNSHYTTAQPCTSRMKAQPSLVNTLVHSLSRWPSTEFGMPHSGDLSKGLLSLLCLQQTRVHSCGFSNHVFHGYQTSIPLDLLSESLLFVTKSASKGSIINPLSREAVPSDVTLSLRLKRLIAYQPHVPTMFDVTKIQEMTLRAQTQRKQLVVGYIYRS